MTQSITIADKVEEIMQSHITPLNLAANKNREFRNAIGDLISSELNGNRSGRMKISATGKLREAIGDLSRSEHRMNESDRTTLQTAIHTSIDAAVSELPHLKGTAGSRIASHPASDLPNF